MNRRYTVTKDPACGLWYAHRASTPNIPIFGSFRKTKRAAQRVAANYMAFTLADYLAMKY